MRVARRRTKDQGRRKACIESSVLRLVFALLVGATLTFICQGHRLGDTHTGPHLSFLGELSHFEEQVVAAELTGPIEAHDEGSGHSATSESQEIGQPKSYEAGPAMSDATSASQLTLLVVALFMLIALRRRGMRPDPAPYGRAGWPQAALPPELPPPRAEHPA
jgi:hypothetical protein